MPDDLGILFLHHDTSAVTRHNLSSIRSQNRDATIVTMSAGRPFRGGYQLAATPEIKNIHALNPARSSDWLVCSWFLQKREKCAKWWIVEWDTFARMSVKMYYRQVWRQPFVAAQVCLPYRDPNWHWFSHVPQLPQKCRPYAAGAVPFLYLVEGKVLERVCAALISNPTIAGNGELRFATVANMCGFPPCGYSPPRDRITWKAWDKLPVEKTIIHPVKKILG
jgi:hypothetical protein